ncbi:MULTISPECIES: TIGR02611 family protein [Streptomyces]|uniref:TIGR02611 family protein n=1 Tax=Streptomyces lycopersici TaxID=2974589 RepID=UPI0021D1B3D4|nr:TIGR02611 family protein [Streptomyces sp. NEAU-383]
MTQLDEDTLQFFVPAQVRTPAAAAEQGGAPGAPGRGSAPGRGAAAEPDAGAAEGATADGRPPGSRAPEFVRRSRALHLGWQVGVFLTGLVVVIAGVLMLPLPGPGWVVIFAGMALWATEFVWAQLVLRWTKRRLAEAAQRAMDPRVRRRNLALATTAAICAGLLVAYVWQYGLVMPWALGG